MDEKISKEKIEEIFRKYDHLIGSIYEKITRIEGNAALKKNEKKEGIKDLIIKEVTKNADQENRH